MKQPIPDGLFLSGRLLNYSWKILNLPFVEQIETMESWQFSGLFLLSQVKEYQI